MIEIHVRVDEGLIPRRRDVLTSREGFLKFKVIFHDILENELI